MMEMHCFLTTRMLSLTRKCNRCGLFKSLRNGSFFEGSRLSLQRHVQFLWKWVQRDSLRAMFFEGIASRKVLIKMARKCREIAWQALILHPIPRLGGPGVIIQIDKSKFNHKSKVSRKFGMTWSLTILSL